MKRGTTFSRPIAGDVVESWRSRADEPALAGDAAGSQGSTQRMTDMLNRQRACRRGALVAVLPVTLGLAACEEHVDPDAGVVDAWQVVIPERTLDASLEGFERRPPPEVLFEDLSVTCPRVDYRYHGVRPRAAPGTILWTRRLQDLELPGSPRGFLWGANPVVHPSGAVSVSTGQPLTVVTFDQEGNVVPTPSAPPPRVNRYDPHDPSPPVDTPFLELVSRGLPEGQDIYYDADPASPYDPLPRGYITGAGYSWIRDTTTDTYSEYSIYCSVGRALVRRLRFARPSTVVITGGMAQVQPGAQYVPHYQNFASWNMTPDGHFLNHIVPGGGYYEGCGYFGVELGNSFCWHDGERLGQCFSGTRDAVRLFPLAGCGMRAELPRGESACFDRHGVRQPVPPSAGRLALYNIFADDSSLLMSAFALSGDRVAHVIIARRDGSVLFDREYTNSDFGVPAEVTGLQFYGLEVGPNGVLYAKIVRTFSDLGMLTAIYLGDDLEPIDPVYRPNWAHFAGQFPYEREFYYRYHATDAERLDAGFPARTPDGGVDDAAASEAGMSDTGFDDAGMSDADSGDAGDVVDAPSPVDGGT